MRHILFAIALMLATMAGAQNQLEQAVDFLYRYMTPADRANYHEEFIRDNARIALYARIDMPWGESVPDELWRHFVLPPRVNNEYLDNFRMQCYDELRRRVQKLTMRDAALEVNHWCHEWVTYRPSDARTSSPLATMRTGKGRCGEESVLAVAAMRTVGIPARQVYTPRWAHTDDNHAWIEVWVDGKWHFMGACEPEPVLDMAWFNTSAARALLMHTQVFGDWQGAEDVIQRNECWTEINCISNYVPTRRTTVTVVDEGGKPVADAWVEYKIFNYSEFCTVAAVAADANGQAALTTGLGDMLVWASHGGRFGYAKMDGEKVRVVLNHRDGDIIDEDIDVCPPSEGMIPYHVTDEQVAANKTRLDHEDQMRARRAATFVTAEQARRQGFGDDECCLIEKAEGNSHEIMTFIQSAGERRADAVLMLQNMTDKDLRDVHPQVLLHRLQQIPHGEGELYGPYILSPRIEREQIDYFVVRNDMTELTADQIRQWVGDSIHIVRNPRGLHLTPQAVYRSRMADRASRDIFFVALCRVNGIPARIESVTGRAEYHDGEGWIAVNFGQAEPTALPQGKLRLDYKPVPINPNPLYYRHFSLAKITDGVGRLLNYEEGDASEMGAVVSAASFKSGKALDAGYYMLTTGQRLSDGRVLAHIRTFNLRRGRHTTVPLVLREGGAEDVSVLGSFDAAPLLPQTGRGYFLAAILDNSEPSSHARQEIEQIDGFLKQWGRPVLRLDAEEYAPLADELCAAVHQTGANGAKSKAPIVVIADSFGRIVFFAQGYNTSLGEQLKRTILHL